MEIWIGLLVLLVGAAAGLGYAVWRAITLWRQLKQTGGKFGAEATRISEAAAGIQAHLDRASASSERLTEALGRLAVSRAALDVELQALREARHTLRRVLWFVPGI
jgi:hypothetical protein